MVVGSAVQCALTCMCALMPVSGSGLPLSVVKARLSASIFFTFSLIYIILHLAEIRISSFLFECCYKRKKE